jgi:hypothetical protein
MDKELSFLYGVHGHRMHHHTLVVIIEPTMNLSKGKRVSNLYSEQRD